MQQQAGQFTPEQLIVAGRRAEAQGQPSYAVQFYRYIAEQYPSTTEAYEARDALYRLTQPGLGAPPEPGYALPHQPALGPANGQHVPQEMRAASSLDSGHGPSHGQLAASGPQRKSAKARKSHPEAHAASDAAGNAVGPGYRVGRLVAAMLGTMGWLLFLSGVLMGPIIFAALSVKSLPKGLREAIAGNLVMVGAGTFGALLLGLFAIFAAQVARASFDTADGVRVLLNASGNNADSH